MPVTPSVLKKVVAALSSPDMTDSSKSRSDATERLLNIHNLYKQLGTLEAVGRRVGVTRERVRQILSKGKKIGLFEYNPREYPFIPEAKIVEDFKKYQKLAEVADLNGISVNYLRKLLTAYSITERELVEYRHENKRTKCIEEYQNFARIAGHHLTTTELQSTSAGHSLHTRINRYWGSIDAFREALNIPKPPQGSSSFREDTKEWRQQRHQISLISRMQQLDQLREYLQTHGATRATELAVGCHLEINRTRMLLSLLLRAGEIKRIGPSNMCKYILV